MFDSDFVLHTTTTCQSPATEPHVNHVLTNDCTTSSQTITGSDPSSFLSNFDLSSCKLPPNDLSKLHACLYDNRDIFVTPNNPELGLTTVVEHKIHLKADMVPKHQRPYRLSPDKKQVLRH